MIDEIANLIVEMANSPDFPKYSHPDETARIYQVFMEVGAAVGQRMLHTGQGWNAKYNINEG